jgi:hypothetical protein
MEMALVLVKEKERVMAIKPEMTVVMAEERKVMEMVLY